MRVPWPYAASEIMPVTRRVRTGDLPAQGSSKSSPTPRNAGIGVETWTVFGGWGGEDHLVQLAVDGDVGESAMLGWR